MLSVQPIESASERIRNEFERIGGGLSTAAFAAHCIEAGIWSEDEVAKFALRGAQSAVRSALKEDDDRGLPFAGQTTEKDDTGAHLWQLRLLWDLDTYGLNIADLETQSRTLNRKASKLRSECVQRYGIVPFTGSAA